MIKFGHFKSDKQVTYVELFGGISDCGLLPYQEYCADDTRHVS